MRRAFLKPGDFDWKELFPGTGRTLVPFRGDFLFPVTDDFSVDHFEAMDAARTGSCRLIGFELPQEWDASEGGSVRAIEVNREIVSRVDVLIGNEEDLQEGLGIPGPGNVTSKMSKLETEGFLEMIIKTVSRQLFLPLFTTHVCHFSPETDAGRGHPAGRKAFGELHLV